LIDARLAANDLFGLFEGQRRYGAGWFLEDIASGSVLRHFVWLES
jgi:hypothetical protein